MEYPGVGVGVIVIKRDVDNDFDSATDEILLGVRKTPFGFGKLSLPGGKLDMFEDLETCGRREVKEETGLEVGNMKLVGVTDDQHRELGKHYLTAYFLADYVGGEPQEVEPDKHGEWKWYPVWKLNSIRDQLWQPCIDKFEALGWIPSVNGVDGETGIPSSL